MGRPNKVKSSRYRKKIDEMIIEGEPDRSISEWLAKQDPPEKIGKSTINSYRLHDFNINDEAKQRYNEQKSQERFEDAVDKQVSDIQKIDELIGSVNPNVMSRLDPKDQVRSVSQLLNTKYKILGVIRDDKPVTVNLNVVKEKGLERLKRIEAEHDDSDSTEPTGCAIGNPPDPPE
ncbi:MAG: hypothetical protein ABFC34_14200 [Methanobacterium sp.]